MSDQTSMERNAKGKRPTFYDAPVVDQMMSMIMVLAGEISVLGDHIDSIERVAQTKGLDLVAGIAALELDQAALEVRETRRKALFDRLFYLMRKEAAEAAAQETPEAYTAVLNEIAVG